MAPVSIKLRLSYNFNAVFGFFGLSSMWDFQQLFKYVTKFFTTILLKSFDMMTAKYIILI